MKTNDWEVNETGTLNALNLKDMALRAALEYIDIIDEKGTYAKEAREQRALVDQFRKEL